MGLISTQPHVLGVSEKEQADQDDGGVKATAQTCGSVNGTPCIKVDTATCSSDEKYDSLDEVLSVMANQGERSTASSTRIAGMISALVALIPMYKLANLAGPPVHTRIRARLEA